MGDEIRDELSKGFAPFGRRFLKAGEQGAWQPYGEDRFVCGALICHRWRCITLTAVCRQRLIFKNDLMVYPAELASQFESQGEGEFHGEANLAKFDACLEVRALLICAARCITLHTSLVNK